MTDFIYEAMPMRVRFGRGSLADLPAEVAELSLGTVLVLATPEQADLAGRVSDLLGERSAGVFAGARMHVPLETAEQARAEAARLGADGCVAVGGGSTTGLGKAIALSYGMPVIAVPTTYAGSEMTPIWGLTENGEKKTGRDRRVLPRSVVYDPELTLSLPVKLSVTSGFNAIAHAVEGLYAPDRSPILSLMAAEGVRSLASALPRVAADPGSLDARSEALQGAWLCGAVLGATTMSLHHKLCHVLGGSLDLPHAETHTVVLPHVLAFNQGAAPDARRTLASAVGRDDPARELQELSRSLGAPLSLAELGMRAEDIEPVVAQAVRNAYANPRAVHEEDVRQLIVDAWRGTAV